MLEFLLLGPVEARHGGADVPLTPLERNLLAILALSRGTVVSSERIIDLLWGDRPPVSPRARVQGLVSALRRKVGDALVTRHPGYLLDLPATGCDLSRSDDLARRAHTAKTPAEAAQRLRQALALWRGEPLDGATAPGLEAQRARLADLHVGLLEECFEIELGLGLHAELVGDLGAAVSAYPLRERLAGQLMIALHRCNRQADAVRAYRALQERLADELGTEPCAELRELRSKIVGGEEAGQAAVPVRPRRPAQLPASAGHFTGRDAELAALTRSLPVPGGEPTVLLISGAGGLGKTALAVRWAHTVADRFPDGQLVADLSTGSAAATLAGLLTALGVSQFPSGTPDRAALFRTLTHGRRFLVLADAASNPAQLLPLVPPTSGSVLVATSRARLTALAVHHATHTLVLEPLGREASLRLLSTVAGRGRLAGEDAGAVADACHGWPLALRLAGAMLTARPRQPAASFAQELRDRVDVLSLPDDRRTVREALDDAYRSLGPAAAQLFARLGATASPVADLAMVAECAGVSPAGARLLLDELIAANLITETGPECFELHRMIWRYAARLTGPGGLGGSVIPRQAVRTGAHRRAGAPLTVNPAAGPARTE